MSYALRELARRVRHKLFPSTRRPWRVVLETTNRCNLNCPFCLVGMQNDLVAKHGNTAHDLLSRPMGAMSEEVFERIRGEIKAFGIEAAFLHFQGEPFLNRMTPEFARRLKADGLYVGIYTNGQAFTDRNIAEVAAARPDLIRFSVDGASEETYQKNRVGGVFANVMANMRKMVEATRGGPTRLEWQFLPLRNNEHEVDAARAMAEDIGVHFFTKGFRETDADLAPTNLAYRSSFLTKPCTDIYKQLGIYWNGDVVPCCYDVDGKAVMGNIMQRGLKEIWSAPDYVRFRRCVDEAAANPAQDPQICRSCLRWR